ncbi:ABC-F family ATP-binding cassette domain-containing protein [Chelatococcus asaccharovorans]|uniref:ATP-binding cassette subfamily F protein 3 n=1 Tax=Chelatococcus asaccharovorans TaxID=28210 RepID=A0A2V3UBH9_9HYPH|nr:ABC-F family ATP-binding cassette domain-containing protein [Chelatococcus asaccharovorans]MBS7703221.1 ABC-F family ATP-binding cassette domain-containing protein [Chelatococcus asaccharovorans]PXW61551.1 ATP-binding cassette subfamily F protein 3 [Chelatococcus asaccharovorans]
MLQINELTYRLGARLLIDRATVTVPSGGRVGLVGRNGAGKTTLFRLIQEEIGGESGTISRPKNWRIGAVAQEAPGGPETLIDVVLAADTERAALMAEAETTTDPMRRADIEIRLVDIDAHSAPARAASILHGLGFDAEAQARPCSSFSGGWRMRVALAAVLFTEPDLLLLDEPTNYLDLEGTLWLYDYLGRYPHTVLVISHDRDLLDTAVDHILHLDQGKLTIYRGGYTSFDRQRREKQALQSKARMKQEAERKHLSAFVERFRAKASKARQAQSRLKRLEKMEPIAAVAGEEVLPFHLQGPDRPLSPPLISIEGVGVGYGDRMVLDRLNLTLLPDDRIALLGSNGNGKSTFAKLLSGRLAPMKGQVIHSPKLKTAYFAQHQLDELGLAETPLQHVAALMPDAPPARQRARAAQFGFSGAKAETPVEKLSGGEKARLLMGLAAFGGAHLLILDEPTNHLDIDSRQALVEAINDYTGAVVLISHDRFLIEACAERLWLVANGTVKSYDGDMDDYRRLVLGLDKSGSSAAREGDASTRGSAPTLSTPSRPTGAPRPSLNAMRKRIGELDARLAKLSTAIAKVDAALADPATFRDNPAKAAELARMRSEAAEALARTEDEWLDATAMLEASQL